MYSIFRQIAALKNESLRFLALWVRVLSAFWCADLLNIFFVTMELDLPSLNNFLVFALSWQVQGRFGTDNMDFTSSLF